MSGEVSGVDLARVALRAALEAARKNGGSGRAVKPKPRTASAVRRGGREPLDLGTAIGSLVSERAWELPAAGAALRRRPGGQRPGPRRVRRCGPASCPNYLRSHEMWARHVELDACNTATAWPAWQTNRSGGPMNLERWCRAHLGLSS
jgi:hypothetical protein